MLVLVATRETQSGHAIGPADDAAADGVSPDYSFTVDGELVTPVVAECATPATCGCDRGFPGFASGQATTTAQVVELEHVTENDLREVIEGALERDGWFDLVEPTEQHELVDEHLDCIAAVCAAFAIGTVVGRHGDVVYDRSIAQAA